MSNCNLDRWSKASSDSDASLFIPPGEFRLDLPRATEIKELLEEKIGFVTGGKDYNGATIIHLPGQASLEDLSFNELRKLLHYLASSRSIDEKERGFCLLVDLRHGKWAGVKPVMRILQESFPCKVSHVYIIKPDGFWERQKTSLNSAKYNYEITLASIDGLHKYISKENLYTEYGGYLKYEHTNWIRMRMAFEKFLFESMALSTKLDEIRRSLLQDDFAITVEGIREQLLHHQHIKKWIIKAPIELLNEEGIKVIQIIKGSGINGNEEELGDECRNAIHQVHSMIDTLIEQRQVLRELWHGRKSRLEQCYQFNIFKQDAEKMLAWIQENRHEFLQNYTEIGNDRETAEEYREEHRHFECNCVEVQLNIDHILQVAEKLHEVEFYDAEVIDTLAQRLDNEWKKLYMAVERRSSLLSSSVAFHKRSYEYLTLGEAWMEELQSFEEKVFTSPEQAAHILEAHSKLKLTMASAYEDVSNEGKTLLGALQRPADPNEEREMRVRSRVSDYSEAASHVMDIVLEMHEQNRQLSIMWERQRVRLNQKYRLCQFDVESSEVIQWIRQNGDSFLSKQTWVGQCSEDAEDLLDDAHDFEVTFEDTSTKAKELLELAHRLAETRECDPEEIKNGACTLDAVHSSFCSKLRKRKEILKMAINFFKCTEKLTVWVEKLKEELNLDDQSGSDNQEYDTILEKHRHQCESTLDALLTTVREGEELSQELLKESSYSNARNSWTAEQENSPEKSKEAVDHFLSQLNLSRQQLEKLWLGKKQKLDYWVQVKNYEREFKSFTRTIRDWCTSWESRDLAGDVTRSQIYLQRFGKEYTEMERSVAKYLGSGQELLEVLRSCGVEVTVISERDAKVDSTVYVENLLHQLSDRKEELTEFQKKVKNKLHQCVQLRKLESDAKRVSSWIRHGETILQATHEPGSSLEEAEALLREYDQFQVAIEKTRLGVMEIREMADRLVREGHYDPDTLQSCARGVELKWEQLMRHAEKRRGVVYASYNFYRASEQVSKLLDKFSKDCKGDEDPCTEFAVYELSFKQDKISALIRQYEQEHSAVEMGCKEVKESSERFLRQVLPQHGATKVTPLEGNLGRLEILVNDLVEQVTGQESYVVKQLQLKKSVLQGCLEYAKFEESAKEALQWIQDHGSNLSSEVEAASSASDSTENSGQDAAEASLPDLAKQNEFKEVFEEIREKVKLLLQQASTLVGRTHFHCNGVQDWAMAIDKRYKDFACRMKNYRKSLEIKLGVTIPEFEDETEWPSLSTLKAKANELSAVTRRDVSNDSGIHEMTEEKRRSAKRIEFIMNELLQTERIYCNDLKCCIENFLYPMLDSPEVPAPLEGQHDTIFGNIEEIFEFHSTIFLQALEKYETRPEDVGNCFTDWADKFQMYVDYCANKPDSNTLLIEHGENFFEDLQAKRNLGLSLAAYLIKPVQRITKYQLLLKELLSCCDDQQGTLQAGLNVMLSVPRQANDTMYLCMIEGFNEGALETLGRILLQDSFTVWDPKHIRRKGKDRHIFLFEQALLFSKEQKDGGGKVRFIYKNKLKTSELGITEHIAEDPCKFAVWTGEPPFTEDKRIIKAESVEVKQMWVKELRELIQQFQFGILRARTSFYPTSPRKKKSSVTVQDTSSLFSSSTRSTLQLGERSSGEMDTSTLSRSSADGLSNIYVCTEDFKAITPNEISAMKGDAVEVLSRPPGSKSWRVRKLNDLIPGHEGLLPFTILRRTDDLSLKNKRSSIETLNSQSSEDSVNQLSDSPSSSTLSVAGKGSPSSRRRSKSVNLGTLKMRTWSRSSGRKLGTTKSPVPVTPTRTKTTSGGGSKKLQHLLGAPESDIDLLLRPSEPRTGTLGRAPRPSITPGPPEFKPSSFSVEDAGFEEGENLSEVDSGSDTESTPNISQKDIEAAALQKRSFVLKELVQTEQDYVNDLETVVELYIPAFSNDSVPEQLRGKERIVFGCIRQIHEFHKSVFLKELEKCEHAPEKLASLFLKAEKKLELYVAYCQNKPKSAALIHDHLEGFCEELKLKFGHRLTLNDYLIKPVQRVMKYQLLLKDFVKYSTRAGLDTTELKKALSVMQVIPKRANDMMNVGMLEGFTGNLSSQGRLLLQETLYVVNAKTRSRAQERRVFLFEQRLLFSEPFERKSDLTVYIYRHSVKMNLLGLTENFDEDPCKWAVWTKGQNGQSEIFVIIGPSPSVKRQWIDAIRGILESQLSFAKEMPQDVSDTLKGCDSAVERPIEHQKKLVGVINDERPFTPLTSSLPPHMSGSATLSRLTELRKYSEGSLRFGANYEAGKISPSNQVLSKPLSTLKHVRLISLEAAKSLEDLTKAFPVQERFIVLENYQAQSADEMTVYKNDIVFLVARPKKNTQFLMVRNFCRERSGYVPANILKRMSEEVELKKPKEPEPQRSGESKIRRAASFGNGDKPKRDRPKRTKSLQTATLGRRRKDDRQKSRGSSSSNSPTKFTLEQLTSKWTTNSMDSSDDEAGFSDTGSECRGDTLARMLQRETRTTFEVAPEFKILPRDVTVDAPCNVKLTCTLAASPDPKITWTKNDTVELSAGNKYNIVYKNHVCMLEILSTHPDDTGTYTVTATNFLGSASCCAKVVVRGLAKPGTPSKPCITTITPTSLILAWDPPDNTDRIPVSAYTVECKEVGTANWQVVVPIVANTSTPIDDLVPTKSFQFRVYANNEVGISEPSSPSDVVCMDLETGSRSLIAVLRRNLHLRSNEEINETSAPLVEWKEGSEELYNIYAELGRGRFSVVKKCVEKSTGTEYAAKLIKRRMLGKETVENEITILRTLNHPAVSKLHDTFESPKNLVLILELLPGGRLFDYIVVMDNLTEKIAIGFIKQVLQALQYIHECNIIHMDLKPENILLCAGTSPRIKLTDFGEAVHVSTGTHIHNLIGSPEFAAPEIICGEPVSLATDMWSLGVIVYVLLSGVSPFYSDNHERACQNIIEIRYKFPQEFFAEISVEAKDLIEELLIRDQGHRPDTAECLRLSWIRMIEPGCKPQAPSKRISLSRLAAFNARRRYQHELTNLNGTVSSGVVYSPKKKGVSSL